MEQPPADWELIEKIRSKLSPGNPMRHAKLEPDKTITWSSTGVCKSKDMEELGDVAASYGRYLHINTPLTATRAACFSPGPIWKISLQNQLTHSSKSWSITPDLTSRNTGEMNM